MVIEKNVRYFCAYEKYNIIYNGKKCAMLDVDDDNNYSFQPIISNIFTNKHVACFINGVRMGRLVLVPYKDKICLMARPELNYHDMDIDFRLSVSDIRKFKSFQLVIN